MPKSDRLVIFFIPPQKLVNGGIMSIFSICKISRQFRDVHKSEVCLATYPGTATYHKNDLFENNEVVYSFEQLIKGRPLKALLLHIPEYASYAVFASLQKYRQELNTITDLRVNILNQNILMMPRPTETAIWFQLTPNVTQTTAHDKYCTQELANAYNFPTHHLSVFNDPEQYARRSFAEKDKMIVLSPDVTKKRSAIVDELKHHFPDYKIVTIQNMRYQEYKDIISRARFTVTFGEGFDGYYIEAFFSGGITFAVYNEDFFPDKDFARFENTYSDYDGLFKNIVKDIKLLEVNPALYSQIVKSNMDKLTKLYDFSNYTRNVKNYYLGKFTYLPRPKSAEGLIGAILNERDEQLAEKNTALAQKDARLAGQQKIISERDAQLGNLLNSHSWRLTKPLRRATSLLKKRRKKAAN